VPGIQEAAGRLDRFMLPEIREIKDIVKLVSVNHAQRVAKMLLNTLHEYLKKREFETEPRRTRTSNRLIKRDKPYLLSGTDYTHPVSDIQKYSRDLYLAFYLLLSSVAKYVGEMLATALRLRRSGD